MYYGDCLQQKLSVYEYDHTNGDTKDTNILVQDELLFGQACVNSLGEIWVGQYYNSSFQPVNELRLYNGYSGSEPALLKKLETEYRANCVCLGGPNLNWLFITNIKVEEEGGNLYVMQVETPGVPEPRFKDG